MIFQLRSIDIHSWCREDVSCLQLSFTTRHILHAFFHHLSLLWDGGSTQRNHCEGPEALPSPISAVRDDRVKEWQEANLPETSVLVLSFRNRLFLTPDSTCSAGDPGLIPGLGRSPGEGNGNPLQYSCLENMDRGAQRASPWGHKESDVTEP